MERTVLYFYSTKRSAQSRCQLGCSLAAKYNVTTDSEYSYIKATCRSGYQLSEKDKRVDIRSKAQLKGHT